MQHEGILWFQKSRLNWFLHGDRNTKYFHSCTISRRRMNKLDSLKIDGEECCFDSKSLEQHFIGFFQTFYSLEYTVSGSFPCMGKFPELLKEERDILINEVSMEEVRRASFVMAPLKAPGVNGFHAKFYQEQWGTVGLLIHDLVRLVMKGAC